MELHDIQYCILMTNYKKLFYTLIRINKVWYNNLIQYEKIGFKIDALNVNWGFWSLEYVNDQEFLLKESWHKYIITFTPNHLKLEFSYTYIIPKDKTTPKSGTYYNYERRKLAVVGVYEPIETNIIQYLRKLLKMLNPTLTQYAIQYLNELYN